MARKKSRETIEKELRQALSSNLAGRGLDSPIYTERVDDYVSFHHILHDLLDDIEENGTMTTDSKTGEIVPRKSVCEAIKASRELGKIYQELDFTALAKKRQEPDGPEDEL